MRASVNQDGCIGCAMCTGICPGVFSMDGEKAQAIPDEVPPESEAAAREAAESCPVSVITVE